MKNRNLVFGGIVLAAGAVCAIAGICVSADNTQLYILLEVIAAALILLGITPLVRAYQNRKDRGETGTDRFHAYADRLKDYYGQAAGNRPSDSRNGFVPPNGWVLAEIVGITRNLRGSGNERVEYYVICRYYDGVTRTNQTFTSKALKDYPGKEIIGKKVKVIFHSKNPEDYTVDLDSIQ